MKPINTPGMRTVYGQNSLELAHGRVADAVAALFEAEPYLEPAHVEQAQKIQQSLKILRESIWTLRDNHYTNQRLQGGE